jgi:hypothetical protein
MQRARLISGLLLVLSCLLVPACLQSSQAPEPLPAPVRAGDDAFGGCRLSVAEPIGEATEASSSAYTFHETLPDDGTGDGGGWQEGTATLEFTEHTGLFSSYSYSCTMRVGMPLRAKLPGRISARFAQQIATEITLDAAANVKDTRSTWVGQGEAFCVQLHDEMLRLFSSSFRNYGVRVNRI